MKVAVLGAGAMGSLFGARLAAGGCDVTLVDVDDTHLDAIRSAGLRLEDDDGDRRVRELAACRPAAARTPPDLLIVFTKTLHTQAALEGVRHLLGGRTHVLSLQNGLGNVEAVARFVPVERILVGVTTWPADRIGPGHVRSRGEGSVRVMTADGRPRRALDDCVSALTAAGLRCRADPDIRLAIWEKAAFNAALNSVCAVAGCTVDGLGQSPEGRMLALRVVDEVAAVARASGVPADAERIAARVEHAMSRHVGHRPSMLQDVLAGRPTEVAAINGAVVAAGAKLGVATPCTLTLLALVRLVEARAVSASRH